MSKNGIDAGKQFEHTFKQSCKDQGIWCFRIADTFFHDRQADANCFVQRQACDYILHYKEKIMMFELKSTNKNYITIERDGARGMIKQHQYDQMTRYAGDKELGGFLIEINRDSIDPNKPRKVYYLDINDFNRFLENNSKKSINQLDILMYGGIEVWDIRKDGKITGGLNIERLIWQMERLEESRIAFPTAL